MERSVGRRDRHSGGHAARASAGGGLGRSIEVCRAVRARTATSGSVLFGYSNPVFVRGPERFANQAARQEPTASCASIGRPTKAPSCGRAVPSRPRLRTSAGAHLHARTGRGSGAAASGGLPYYVSMTASPARSSKGWTVHARTWRPSGRPRGDVTPSWSGSGSRRRRTPVGSLHSPTGWWSVPRPFAPSRMRSHRTRIPWRRWAHS